ncbi:MAG: DUF2232 domain-containing protein [Alphaproteobacteria bacterium]|nr:DUF2232 domain-containing protein [Alphaproteobacteria bacterium]
MPIFALAAAAGLASALFYAMPYMTGSLGSLFFAQLAQLPLFVIGLWMGFVGAALAAAAAIIALALAGGMFFALAYTAINALPAVAMTYLAQLNRPGAEGGTEWYPAGALVGWLVGVALAAFGVYVIGFSGTEQGAEGAIRSFVEAALKHMTSAGLVAGDPVRLAPTIAHVLPGVVANSWIAMVVLNAVLAQALLGRLRRNLRPAPRMAEIDLPGWMRGLAVIALAASFFPGLAGFGGVNLLLILGGAFVLAGLGVFHAMAERLPHAPLPLIAFYGAVTLAWPVLGPIVIVASALLGAAEPWLNLRRRFGGSGT